MTQLNVILNTLGITTVGKYEIKGGKTLTWKPSFTVSICLIGSSVGLCHRLGSQRIVLLNANPDISAWNLRNRFFLSFVCHPKTCEPLQIGPSKITCLLFSAILGIAHVPNRLHTITLIKNLHIESTHFTLYHWLSESANI